MARLNTIDPSTATGKAKELFDGPLKGKHLNIFKGMANSPAGLQAYLGMAGALGEGKLSAQEREVIALVTAQQNDCEYCLAAHTHMGKGAGLTEAQTIAARRGELDDANLGALATFTRSLLEKKGFADEGDLKAFKNAGYDDGHVVETIANVGLNFYTNFFNHVNETDVDLPEAPKLETAGAR
ncbi:MAG: carboxymuconolactone decarboxylase family protein [Phycisphaerales bacterium JB060]